MTKKDFELIASIIKDFKGWWQVGTKPSKTMQIFAIEVADTLESKNPRFKRDVFLKACGVEDNTRKCLQCSKDCFYASLYCKEHFADIK